MDTLFRLVSLQSSSDQRSYNSSRTSSSSRSSKQNNSNNSTSHYYYSPNTNNHYYFQEECNTNQYYYMDEDFSSSSSSKHFHSQSHHHPSSSTTPVLTPAQTPPPSSSSTGAHALFDPADFSYPSDLNLDFPSPSSSSSSSSSGRWAHQLLIECARAVATRDSQRVQQLMWMLNELSSPYGDTDQKLSSYFLQGLFARLTSSGPRTLHTLVSASDRNTSFESTRRTALKFQELSPWSPFGHVAANGAILDSFLEAAAAASSSSQPIKFHILDLSNTFCTQWPTLLEALATRSSDDTPHLSLTTVVASSGPAAAAQRVMKEIGQRMEKFARLMGVPFRFNVVHHSGDLSELNLDGLDLSEGGSVTAIAVNCINTLRGVSPLGRRRDTFIAKIRRLEPRIVTIVEEEADLVEEGPDEEEGFLKVFREGLKYFSAYIDSLEESFPRTSNERLALEREVGRAVVDLVACPAEGSGERRETAASWTRRMRTTGFSPVAFSEDVVDDMRTLLRRYREGWSMREVGSESDPAGFFLAWKEEPVVWASAWRP
ncbi:GRAS transcription factor [Rhynchospora pubera]|uniref:GRAS transcription factor n=1 Tax=Rhynchospora pubera TaxID=906938 RepID=A0AAV8FEP2_9POAL|nr:GRAS transcription factor [Rhynchospora pubera]KAJ4791504.1 GRAS transcription factor [Rhynchospora pubera]KAJ4815331.1 GRAS transcription factor [Rhynchospora pubera]